MRPFSFLHAADLHLDTPFDGIGKVAPDLQQKLRDASLAAFDNLIDTAIARAVDFVVIAGDIYDGAERGTRAQSRFLSGLRRLGERSIGVLFIHGNHDPVAVGWSAIRASEFPPSTVLFSQCDEVRAHVIERGGEPLAAVHGISFRETKEKRNLSRFFRRDAVEAPFHIGLLHTNAGGNPAHDNYAPCSLDDLRTRGMDYWALGHIHLRGSVIERDPVAHYSGNVQARSFKEVGPRGATLVHVEGSGAVRLEFVQLGVIDFVVVRLDLTVCESLDQVAAQCEAAAERASVESDGRFVMLRLELTGRTPVHGDLLRAAAHDELASTLRERIGARAWLDDVKLAVFPPIDRAELARSAAFEGVLVQFTDALTVDATAANEALDRLREPLRAGTRFREFCVGDESATDIWCRAEARLLAALQEKSACD